MRAAATSTAMAIGTAVAASPVEGKTRLSAVNACWTTGAERMMAAAAATASARRTIRPRMLPLLGRRLPPPRAGLALGHLGAGLPRLGQPDRNRLLAACHLPARSTPQRAALALVHRALDLLTRLASVLGHGFSSNTNGYTDSIRVPPCRRRAFLEGVVNDGDEVVGHHEALAPRVVEVSGRPGRKHVLHGPPG